MGNSKDRFPREETDILDSLSSCSRQEFLAYPTGISVNLTGASKCHLILGE